MSQTVVTSPEWIKEQFTNDEVKECLAPVRHPLEIAVHDSSNYFNFGSIIRISHNFLLSKLWAVDMESGYYKKASMGARKYELVEKVVLDEFIEKTRDKKVIVLERRPDLDSKCIYDYEWPFDGTDLLFFGSEKFGVPDKVIEEVAYDVVSIPVYGVLNDYNVAQAAGITIYDWMNKFEKRQRQ